MLPAPDELPGRPQRVVCHWTAGGHEASAVDREHYHVLIEAWGEKYRLQEGVPLSRNMQECSGRPSYATDPETGYAAHTAGLNSFSIGLALCGMRGAERTESGVSTGPTPIMGVQVEGLVDVLADCRLRYGLDPEPRQMLGHYEVPEVYGISQPGKWDPSWFPVDIGDADAMDWLRARVHEEIQAREGG